MKVKKLLIILGIVGILVIYFLATTESSKELKNPLDKELKNPNCDQIIRQYNEYLEWVKDKPIIPVGPSEEYTECIDSQNNQQSF